jgi:hypothetical protein
MRAMLLLASGECQATAPPAASIEVWVDNHPDDTGGLMQRRNRNWLVISTVVRLLAGHLVLAQDKAANVAGT